MNPLNDPTCTRRAFLEKSAAALAATATVGLPFISRGAADDKPIRIALVGCGGRGSGAANQALNADPGTVLVAMADAFKDRLETSLNNLRATFKEKPEKVKVTPETSFIGLDAIDKVLAMPDVDVVLLATPPGFRPEHFEKCVKAGKHAFCEKPAAVDAPGYRRFLEAAKLSREKGLGVQSGFCWRSHYLEREVYQRVLGGDLGQIESAHGTYLGGTPWVKPRQEAWTDLEYHLRNWIHMTWLSGDHIVEQAIHTVDKMSWTFGDAPPVSAQGMGGRQQRVEEEYGNGWDHFSIVYDYGEERRGFIMCRQQAGCWGDVSDYVYATKGALRKRSGTMAAIRYADSNLWKYDGKKNDMYQTEHDEFFASLRAGKPLNFAEKLAHSSMVGILGRMAAYTGQPVTWEDAIKSNEKLGPDALDWGMKLPVQPIAMPGRTKFS
ncbi:MAG: myo-inositol 2-dehydrogenase / D-chiro-inositol 1-dehydrogenase [Chthoniobacter sp.]|jgi:predicted dehydrogenase|nr:myo-inositol 2-dehydrogenase / D-chiro-inositol 1-dehydrogenase [Chthoniobacter sp.]